MTRVGVLALQGDVREHLAVLDALGAAATTVRTPAQLDDVDALVVPGGESSVIDRLSRILGLREPLRRRIADGMPVLGTCAGLILLADRVLDAAPGQQTLGGLDVTVRRNAYGSQVDSFETAVAMPAIGERPVAASFIRAPVVEEVGDGVAVLGRHEGRIVAVEQGARIGVAFHPELVGDDRVHRRLLDRAA
ncbi:pyridoxal 5'-phosphate synthase glutaminase subunit PdxT [Agrococcus sp. SGAir0287]|uniref:pyridoxal 5'-phosphate synthase glutaminase subunit PdxT n=1 Tax=Agrococcus sp. SGAir0287 TaxID=2070347 RepID=UPI0010CCDDBF|nr:pyridoxal 5'-phosphate synthase glutaminase subunit PdxT [Agrococcus sp. SGAir0287]QCR20506.1 pyridoxal 5'-phosphate synthase glutaminase subunit PdxT [Agrococcus sp. SGAir0287]